MEGIIKNKIDWVVKCVLFAIGVLFAAILIFALGTVLNSKSDARIIIPKNVAIAERTIAQTFFEKSPIAGETTGDLIAIPQKSLALESLIGPNADVYISFNEDYFRAKSVISVPFPHFESVEMRNVSCREKPFNKHQENWQRLKSNKNGSFYYEVSLPLKCFELRFAGITPMNLKVEFLESAEAMRAQTDFETTLVHIPYYTFLAAVLGASCVAFLATRDPILPMYICYIVTVCVFSFFMDGNGYVFFTRINASIAIKGFGAGSLFAVTMVAWMWMKILGESRLFAMAFWINLLTPLYGLFIISEAVVRWANIVAIASETMMIVGGSLKLKHLLANQKTRFNAIYMFLGLCVFNVCACVWVLQNLTFIESTLWTRNSVKLGFVLESSFFMWAIANSYRNKQHELRKILEQEKKEYYEAALQFVPQCLLDILHKDDIRSIDFGTTVELIGTIVCIDIKGFTQWSEHRPSKEIILNINESWAALIPAVHKLNGAIVNFTGDGLILLFPDDPLDALTFVVSTMHRKKSDPTFIPSFEFGMGVHYGTIILGAVGQKTQMSLTVLSDIVNTAARIETVTRDIKSMLVVSAAFIRACGFDKKSAVQIISPRHKLRSNSLFTNVGVRFLGTRLFKGKRKPIELYEIAIVDDASEFKQMVDFINRNENLRRSSESQHIYASGLSQAVKESPILAHYMKYTDKMAVNLEFTDDVTMF